MASKDSIFYGNKIIKKRISKIVSELEGWSEEDFYNPESMNRKKIELEVLVNLKKLLDWDQSQLLKNMEGIEREIKALVRLRLHELQSKYIESESYQVMNKKAKVDSANSNERMLQDIAYPQTNK